MSAPAPTSVILVGGSLAGLMHALTLLSLPSPPQKLRLLERSPTSLLHNQGAGVVAGAETQQFFSEYVRPGRDIAVVSPQRHYLNRKGEVMPETVRWYEQRMTSWDLLYHLLRWRVEGLESEYVTGLDSTDGRPKIAIENGCTVTNLKEIEGGGKVKVTWQHKDRGEESDIADMIIGADGASSTIRRILAPEVERKYVDYVAWRGTVPEDELSEEARKVFVERFTFFHSEGLQILAYLIPGHNGSLIPGTRLLNWVWYCNYPAESKEFNDLMTDITGKRHALTLPVGKMNPSVFSQQKVHANSVLPPQYAEAISKTKQPFVQAITDVISPNNRLLRGKVLLVGDALAGFRPHTAASTGQAAYDAIALGAWFRGEIDEREYDGRVLSFAQSVQEHGVVLGERSQFGRHPYNG